MSADSQISAARISAVLEAARQAGRSLVIVSLLSDQVSHHGQSAMQTQRMLIEENSDVPVGSLGEKTLDEYALRYAHHLLADERQEIITAFLSEIVATLAGTDFSRSRADDSGGVISDKTRLLFEISRPLPQLIVCGGGHVGQAVARAGRLLDFQVTVIDDRAEFASREKFPDESIHLMADDFIAALQMLRITPASHIVIVTRGHKHDEMCLREVIDKPARYIGMIGSRRRTTTIRTLLQRDGVSAALLEKLHAPIGLDIGAQTPEEIALAILAEIILLRRGGTSLRKSDFKGIAALRKTH
jgi:xanthine/CO dehydrogenase XdhC/CoxF family maturation factor